MDEKPIVINIPAVDTWNITDLRYTCKRNKVKGYTKMSREELISEVKRIVANFNSNKENLSRIDEERD